MWSRSSRCASMHFTTYVGCISVVHYCSCESCTGNGSGNADSSHGAKLVLFK